MNKIISFFKEAKVELSKVIWPSRQRTVFLTLVVIAITVTVALIIGLFDYGFLRGIEQVLTKFK